MEFPSQFNVLALSALPVFWMLWELGANRMFSSVLAVLCARDVLEAPSVLGCFGRAMGSVDALGAQGTLGELALFFSNSVIFVAFGVPWF